jgi:hypothetical protein
VLAEHQHAGTLGLARLVRESIDGASTVPVLSAQDALALANAHAKVHRLDQHSAAPSLHLSLHLSGGGMQLDGRVIDAE